MDIVGGRSYCYLLGIKRKGRRSGDLGTLAPDMELTRAQRLAEKLIRKHKLSASGWTFAWDRARLRFGCCKYAPKQITLSKALTRLNGERSVRNTVLHEIAHALCPGQGHGRAWRAKALEIGCDGRRCYSSRAVEPACAKWVASCAFCGRSASAHRLRRRSYSCVNCSGGRYDPKYRLEFRPNPAAGRRARPLEPSARSAAPITPPANGELRGAAGRGSGPAQTPEGDAPAGRGRSGPAGRD